MYFEILVCQKIVKTKLNTYFVIYIMWTRHPIDLNINLEIRHIPA